MATPARPDSYLDSWNTLSRVLNKHNTVMIRKDTKQQESFDESLLYNKN